MALIKKFQITSVMSLLNLLLTLNIQWDIVKAEYGGHDLFTSLAQLEVLWQNDINVVQQMEKLIAKLETAISTFKS